MRGGRPCLCLHLFVGRFVCVSLCLCVSFDKTCARVSFDKTWREMKACLLHLQRYLLTHTPHPSHTHTHVQTNAKKVHKKVQKIKTYQHLVSAIDKTLRASGTPNKTTCCNTMPTPLATTSCNTMSKHLTPECISIQNGSTAHF